MWKMVWTEQMSVAIKELDDDHKQAMAIINELEDALTHGDRDASIRQAHRLLLTMGEHFGREERLLAEHGYHRLEEHLRNHREAGKRLAAFGAVLSDRPVTELLPELQNLKVMFIERLILDDLDYKWFFLDRGLRPKVGPVGAGGVPQIGGSGLPGIHLSKGDGHARPSHSCD